MVRAQIAIPDLANSLGGSSENRAISGEFPPLTGPKGSNQGPNLPNFPLDGNCKAEGCRSDLNLLPLVSFASLAATSD